MIYLLQNCQKHILYQIQEMKASVLLIVLLISLAMCRGTRNEWEGSRNEPKVKRINTQTGPKALGPYSTASVYKGIIYISGQIGIDPKTGDLVGADIQSQTKRALTNLKNFFGEVNVEMGDIIKCTVYLKNMSDFAKMNDVYGTFFPAGQYPSRVAIQVSELPKGALVELETMAAIGDDSIELL